MNRTTINANITKANILMKLHFDVKKYFPTPNIQINHFDYQSFMNLKHILHIFKSFYLHLQSISYIVNE